MALRMLRVLAFISVSSVSAFRNTSPFFLFSTDKYATASLFAFRLKLITSSRLAEGFEAIHPQLVTSADINSQVLESIKHCPSATYFIVHQDKVSSSDYLDGRSTPYLSRWLGGADKSIASSAIVPEVIGSVDEVTIRDYLRTRCGAESVSINGASTYPWLTGYPSSQRGHC